MTAIKQLVAAGLLLVAVAGTVSATPVTWSDIISFSPPVLISEGNVYGGGSTLTVHGHRGSGSAARRVSVPEPSTLALMGLGLLAVSFAARRKKPTRT